MKLWKKILLITLGVIILTQMPFCYNRCNVSNLSTKISALETQKTALENPNYKDYKGIIHAHTSLGGHSTGNFDELIEGAEKNTLDFVVMTEHTSPLYDTSHLTLNGVYKGVLFVGGNELDTANSDRFLLIPGSPDAPKMNAVETYDVLKKFHAENKIAFITYPEKFKTWDSDFDGIEVYSLHTNAKQMNIFTGIFDAIWSFSSYPKETFATYFKRPDENLQKFDQIALKRKITLFAGNDSHSNIGFHILGDDAGNKLINFKFDRYEMSFGLVRTHVLLEKDKELTRENLVEALKQGKTFIGFDVLSDTSGFMFSAENGVETRIMGGEISLGENPVSLKAVAPQTARFVFFKNGEKVSESEQNTQANLQIKEKGTYRVEVYLDSLGSPFNETPWIISNPIYVN
jgi:hypothetical protein